MALSVGDKAPDFDLSTMTADGPARVKLSDHAGRNLVLLFFPAAFTGVCTDEFCSVTSALDEYQALNATVLGISGDSPFAQAAWAKKENINLPLASDYGHDVAKAYGVAYESFLPEKGLGMAGVAKRSAFLIDKDGVIQHAESSDDPTKLPDFDAIKAKLSQLS